MKGYWWCDDCGDWIPNVKKKEVHYGEFHRDMFELVVDEFGYDWKKFFRVKKRLGR